MHLHNELLIQQLLSTRSKEKWERLDPRRRSGIAIPLFSLYSSNSLGIGDLRDLELLVEFCKLTENSILQLLPMNEVGGTFCPYDSISSFALEPMYLSFSMMPETEEFGLNGFIENAKVRLPAGLPHVDYRVKKEKIEIAKEIFKRAASFNHVRFKEFQERNKYWLPDFALYKALKGFYNGLAWYEWEDCFKYRDEASLKKFWLKHEEEIIFEEWLQWRLYEQFIEVKRFAAAHGVLLKGDLPILVSRDSADVWQRPEFFKLEFAAGAPPDMYCARGQRWGMPTYNWPRIAADDYRYLKEKLRFAGEFYDILRIDHVVGLFRIWSIPYNDKQENKGLNGAFDPADERLWWQHGRALLSVINENTPMLLCAEDLGVIPKVCPDTLAELGIPGNDVQRWVKDWNTRHDFLSPQEYRVLSVNMLSTHDTTNFTAWWEYEAGTVDEELFTRKCREHSIDFSLVRDKLFDLLRSYHKRLRWLPSISSVEALVAILGQERQQAYDFIDLYLNSFQEKEKLFSHLGLSGNMREPCDREILSKVFKFTLEASSIFSIHNLIDWLYLADIFGEDVYNFRINTPGTLSPENWSLTIPLPLEKLLSHEVIGQIKDMVVSAGRA